MQWSSIVFVLVLSRPVLILVGMNLLLFGTVCV